MSNPGWHHQLLGNEEQYLPRNINLPETLIRLFKKFQLSG